MAETETKPAPPLTERGSANPGQSFWTYPVEETPELQWPLSVKVYDRMRRQDAQIASVLRAVSLPVRRTKWWVDGTGCRPEVTALVAADLGLSIKGQDETPPVRTRDRFAWSEHLRLALLMLPFGHMFFEQVYRYDDAGMVRLRKLAPRLPKTIDAINVARDGGLESIEQGTPSGSVKIPVTQLVAYVNDREGGNWLGTSILRPAYKHWVIKDMLIKVQAQTVERNGMGIPVYEGGVGETDLSKGLELAKSVRSGSNAGAATPDGATLKLLGVEGTLPDADKPIRYHDQQIVSLVLAHFLNLGQQSGTGSWALGTTFADFFTLSLQSLATQVADTANQHIVEDLVDLNWGPDEPAPRIVFEEIGSQQIATAQALKLLLDGGAIFPDRSLEEALRQQYGLPPKDRTATVPPADQGA